MELTGLPMVAARGSELVSADRVLANILGIAVAGTVLAIGLRRRTDAVLAVGSAVLATGAGLFLIWLSGTELTPITVALGSLTAAVGCEFAVVLAEAARRGRSPLRIAVPLVTGASVLGYVVLLASGSAVVRQFGLQLAGAVVLSMLSSLVVLWVLRSFRPSAPAVPATSPPSRIELSVVGAD
jgi:predicted RND superfamily exporter protein